MSTRDAQPFVDTTPELAPVRGSLYRAAEKSGDFLVLTHGAGGNARGPLLVALGEKLSEAGIHVLCCDLPFRQRKPQGPPSPSDSKRDQEGLRRAVELMKQQFSGRAFLGGSSYGGRQASMLLADDPSVADGLLLLSYPLHPPGRAEKLRTAHFPNLRTPALFISGTRDAFGTIDELAAAIKLIPARTELVPIDGAAHGLWAKSNRTTLPDTIVADFQSFFLRQ